MRDETSNEIVRSITHEISKLGENTEELSKQVLPYIIKQVRQEEIASSHDKRLEVLEEHMQRHCNIVDRGKDSLVSKMNFVLDILAKRDKTIEKLQWLAVTCIIGLIAFFLKEVWTYYHK